MIPPPPRLLILLFSATQCSMPCNDGAADSNFNPRVPSMMPMLVPTPRRRYSGAGELNRRRYTAMRAQPFSRRYKLTPIHLDDEVPPYLEKFRRGVSDIGMPDWQLQPAISPGRARDAGVRA